jgi:uncharacterized membrane protein
MKDKNDTDRRARFWSRLAGATLLALIALCMVWEGWLAPLRPGGSWMILKALPLLPAVPGVLRGRRYTSQWLSMLTLFYLAEGVVRMGDPGLVAVLASFETALALALFVAVLGHAHNTAPSRRRTATTAD